MCNDYRLKVDLDTIASDFSDLRVRIDFPEGRPNLAARDDIRITDVGPVIRAGPEPGAASLVQRRWSWPGPTGRPVYAFRSEGRTFGPERCLVVADGFYEFTAPEPGQRLKTKWLFTMPGHRWFGIAGIVRSHPDVGEAFTLLTVEPGPDVAPYHSRQVVPLGPDDWMRWLDQSVPAGDLLKPSPPGSLLAQRVR